jgi:hypothetical protein
MPPTAVFRTAKSYLSGRTLHVNTSAEFAVPPTFSVEQMRHCAEVIAQIIRDSPTKTRHSLALRKLWHFDLQTWPLLPNEQAKAFALTKKWLWEPERQELLNSLASLDTNEEASYLRIRGVMTLVMASAGSKDIGDFTPGAPVIVDGETL